MDISGELLYDIGTRMEGTGGMVYLRDFIDPKRIVIMGGGGKIEILDRLIELSRSDELIEDFEKFRKEVFHRESILSTGIGMGVALPHVKTKSVRAFFITIGVFRDGVDWDSLDGKPVNVAFLIGGPENHQEYLQILAKLTLIIRNDQKRRKIAEATSPEQVLEQFADL
jgi:PTS system nitrogen regulatory IIA component